MTPPFRGRGGQQILAPSSPTPFSSPIEGSSRFPYFLEDRLLLREGGEGRELQRVYKHIDLTDLLALLFFFRIFSCFFAILLSSLLTIKSTLSVNHFLAIFRFDVRPLWSWQSTVAPVGTWIRHTLLQDLLIFCPPGPDPLTNFSTMSFSSIVNFLLLLPNNLDWKTAAALKGRSRIMLQAVINPIAVGFTTRS